MPEPQHIVVGDVDVAYRRAGQGSPLLFLHGSGLTRRWLELYGVLAERFDVIVPEHPGFGDTPRPPWYRSLDDIAVHYADFLTALGVERVAVVGHSFGGRVAGSFAALYPERVTALTLITPAPLATVSPADVLDPPTEGIPADFDFDSLLFNDNQAAYEAYRNGDDMGELVAAGDGDAFADPAAWSLDTVPSLYRRLARVDCPVQVLVPDEDRVIPRECFDAWAHWLGDAPVITIPGGEHPTAHLLIVQEPRAIAEKVGELAEDGRSDR